MSSTLNQQPIGRTIGRRKERDGHPLSAADRDAMQKNARYITRAPKGLYLYRSADDMNADRQRWTVDAMTANALQRTKQP